MNNLFSTRTPVGILTIEDDGKRIVSVKFEGKQVVSPVSELQKETDRQLKEYFAGERQSFDIPVYEKGTLFQMKVWDALKEIPYGTTVSYQELAERIGNPKACRAVGMAIHNNPVVIIVPCHRVIHKDGSVGGYAGGVEKKKILLNLEKENAGEKNSRNYW